MLDLGTLVGPECALILQMEARLMRKLLARAIVIGLLGFLALNLAGAPDKTADLKRADQDWAAAVAARNLDQFMGFIAEDAYMCDLSGKWMHGKGAIKADWTAAFADP